MVKCSFKSGQFNVHYLTASYDHLVKAFGNDGDNDRDDYKSMCQWDIKTPYGEVEVYDYKVGVCYDPGGFEREAITDWHVQGETRAIGYVLGMLGLAE